MRAGFDGPHRLQIALDGTLPGQPTPAEARESKERTHLVALDIGAGPGTFGWVVHDYVLSCRNVDLRLFALDHCPNMVHLARALWQRMKTRGGLRMDSDWRRISGDFSGALRRHGGDTTVIVTIGHLLVQIADNATAIDQVAKMVAQCVSLVPESAPRRRCLVIAADAHSRSRQDAFKRAWRRLQHRLADTYGVLLSAKVLFKYSQMCGEALIDPTAGS